MKAANPGGLCEVPQIDWQQHTPSQQDMYFNPEQGLEESAYVYIAGNDLPTRFQACRGQFVIGEIGFGSGLNFLATVRSWHQHVSSASAARLTYVAFEPYPLAPEQLRHVYAQFPTLTDSSDRLLAILPPLISGSYALAFASNIQLVLHQLPVQQWQGRLVADAWFYDAFAPLYDPDSWSNAVCAQLACWSKQGTTLSTFSAAQQVQIALAAQGFEVAKHKGFGRKRHMLRAVFSRTAQYQPPYKPPYKPQDKSQSQAKRIAVIGGGLAGCATFAALCASAGLQDEILLIERRTHLAERASRNRHAVLFAKVPWLAGRQQRWLWYCWCASYSLFRLYPDLFTPIPKTMLCADRRGSKWLAGWRGVYCSRALEHWLAFDWEGQQLTMPRCGRLDMQSMARTLAGAHVGEKQRIYCSTRVNAVRTSNGKPLVELYCDGKITHEQCTHVVLCTNSATSTLVELQGVLNAYKGQVNRLEVDAALQQIYGSHQGYAAPLAHGQIEVGGCFQKNYTHLRTSSGQGMALYRDLSKLFGWQGNAGKEISQWADVRSVAKDHLPLVGETTIPGVWLNTGFGGKGSLAIVPTSRLLAAKIYGDTGGEPVELIAHLAPDRFTQGG